MTTDGAYYDTTDWGRINVAAFFFNFVTVSAGRLRFMGKNNRDISRAHPTLITPAGWAMKIWFVIFLAEMMFVVWQSRKGRGRSDAVAKGIGACFAAACVLQAMWNFAFSLELMTLSAVLLSLVATCMTIAAVRLAAYKKGQGLTVLSLRYWLLHFPLGLHAGWSTNAALVMIHMALEPYSLSTRVSAVMITTVFATVAAGSMASLYDDQAYLCGIAWAMYAIADNVDFRQRVLPFAVADGLSRAFSILALVLLIFGACVVLVVSARGVTRGRKAGKVARNGSGGTGAGREVQALAEARVD